MHYFIGNLITVRSILNQGATTFSETMLNIFKALAIFVLITIVKVRSKLLTEN